MGKPTLDAKALHYQLAYVKSKAKFPLLVAGYGSGKTHALIYRLLRFISETPNCIIGCYLPTIDLAKKILIPRLEEIFGGAKLKYKLNKTEGTFDIWLKSGKARIIIKSMDNPAVIIGYETTHSLIDEIDTMPAAKATTIWEKILSRNRKKFINPDGSIGINTIGVTSTPEGFGFLYQTWVKKHSDDPDYQIIRGRTADNYHLPPDYIDNLKASYPPQLIKAYLEGEFVNLQGSTVYSSFNRHSCNTDLTIKDFPSANRLHIGMDFNVGRMAAVVMMKGEDDVLYVVDEIHHVSDTPTMILTIQLKYPNRLITVYPDASGSSRKSVDSSKTDHKLLRGGGFQLKSRKKNPNPRERSVIVNTAFLNANGERNLFVNVDKCPELTEQLEKQVFDKNSDPVKDGKEDPLDALGYGITNMKSLTHGTAQVARMRFGI